MWVPLEIAFILWMAGSDIIRIMHHENSNRITSKSSRHTGPVVQRKTSCGALVSYCTDPRTGKSPVGSRVYGFFASDRLCDRISKALWNTARATASKPFSAQALHLGTFAVAFFRP